jgi:hypothetical protein
VLSRISLFLLFALGGFESAYADFPAQAGTPYDYPASEQQITTPKVTQYQGRRWDNNYFLGYFSTGDAACAASIMAFVSNGTYSYSEPTCYGYDGSGVLMGSRTISTSNGCPIWDGYTLIGTECTKTVYVCATGDSQSADGMTCTHYPYTCPEGSVPSSYNMCRWNNPAQCIGQQTYEEYTNTCVDPVCPTGQELEPATKICRTVTPPADTCPTGLIDLAPDISGAQCGAPPQCSPGYHNSPETGLCVPEGTACVASGVKTCQEEPPPVKCSQGFMPDPAGGPGCVAANGNACVATPSMGCPNPDTPPPSCSEGYIPDPGNPHGCIPASGQTCVATSTMGCPRTPLNPPPIPTTPPPTCPAGMTLDVWRNTCRTQNGPASCPAGWSYIAMDGTNVGHCVPPPPQQCQTGYHYDSSRGTCVQDQNTQPPQCGEGLYWNWNTRTCMPYQPPSCPDGYHYDGSQCQPDPGTPECPAFQYYDKAIGACTDGTPPRTCGNGWHWDAAKDACKLNGSDDPGTDPPSGGNGTGDGPATNQKLEELRKEIAQSRKEAEDGRSVTISGNGGAYTKPDFLDAPEINASTDHLMAHLQQRPFFQQIEQIKAVTPPSLSACPLVISLDLSEIGMGTHSTDFICQMLEAARPWIQLAMHVVYAWGAILIFMTA